MDLREDYVADLLLRFDSQAILPFKLDQFALQDRCNALQII